MSPLDSLLSVVAIWFIALMTPGPNMLFFTGVALSSSRRSLAAAGCGIVLGTAFWGLSGLFGLLWLFEVFPVLGVAVKIAGGAYLAFIGFKILRAGLAPEDHSRNIPKTGPLTVCKAFWLGLATHLSNPKSLVFVTSLQAATQLAHAPLWLGLTSVLIMCLMSGSYYVLYGGLLSFTPITKGSSRLKRFASLGVGAMMMLFGSKMALGK
jgi:threonine/homoserine/homoserine lactone efflux protein